MVGQDFNCPGCGTSIYLTTDSPTYGTCEKCGKEWQLATPTGSKVGYATIGDVIKQQVLMEELSDLNRRVQEKVRRMNEGHYTPKPKKFIASPIFWACAIPLILAMAIAVTASVFLFIGVPAAFVSLSTQAFATLFLYLPMCVAFGITMLGHENTLIINAIATTILVALGIVGIFVLNSVLAVFLVIAFFLMAVALVGINYLGMFDLFEDRKGIYSIVPRFITGVVFVAGAVGLTQVISGTLFAVVVYVASFGYFIIMGGTTAARRD